MQTEIKALEILKNIHKASGMRVSLHDAAFNEIIVYPKNIASFCSMLQNNPKAKIQCLAAHSNAFDQAKHAGEIYLHKCRFGLYEAICPLRKDDVLLGYLIIGQAIDTEESSKEYIFSSAAAYWENETEIKNKISLLPRLNPQQIKAFSEIISLCSESVIENLFIGKTSYAGLAESTVAYINKNINTKLTINSICKTFNCSKSTLINYFKKEFNITINEYITSKRIKIAKNMLRDTGFSIKTIAEKCGYSDQLYFSKSFSRNVGMSPSEYRANQEELSKNGCWSKQGL